MEKVVYLLGAGFSAPLGLPVVSNFLEQARNLYQNNKGKYKHFQQVFQSIKERLAYVSLYYRADLTNIEEILSILEMERLISGGNISESDEFVRFIMDVVEYYTPAINGGVDGKRKSKGVYEYSEAITPWSVAEKIILTDMQQKYGKFILKLFNAELDVVGIGENSGKVSNEKFKEFEFRCKLLPSQPVSYSVVTINYDLVLENFAAYYSSLIQNDELKFLRPQSEHREGFPSLAKLHGSLDSQNIIPPTWNKSLHAKIEQEWKYAYRLLASANHIRILGYSLPDNDAYIKYLLKSSLLESENLKTIDVICLDNTGHVKNRYDSFILLSYPKYRYVSIDLAIYLSSVTGDSDLERGHNEFIAGALRRQIG